jgi:NADPH2:quinone reductase
VKAVVLEQTGGPEALVLRDVPEPETAPGASLVDVRAVGMNYLEVLVRQGRYPQAPELPWIPGVEVAGESGGRRVLGLVRDSGGGYAERVAIEDDWLFDLPEGASFEEGAAFAMAFLTSWIPMTRIAPVRPGTRVLVTAAAGGTGSAAVQVATLLGAEVVAAAGSQEKLGHVRDLGAGEAVTYEELEGIEPVDVVFDLVGGDLFERALGKLRPLGLVVGVGFAGGLWRQLDPALLVGRNIGVRGFYLGRLMRHRPELVQEAAADLVRLWARGLVHPVVGATFPLADAAEAHRLVEERRSRGKVVLVP